MFANIYCGVDGGGVDLVCGWLRFLFVDFGIVLLLSGKDVFGDLIIHLFR